MFTHIKLKCFRQHRDLEINFEAGVIALRGANEAGKTTLLEALAYSHFGAVALREPLAEVVTYGEKDSALKTETTFRANGVDYITTRSKSGAQVCVGTKVVCTGQTEVRKFWEAQHGASWETVTNLMLASQQGLRGALSKGPGAAVELIENLANFSLIEHVIALVQKHLPNGGTAMTEARIRQGEQTLAQPLEDTTKDLKDALTEAEKELAAAQAAQTTARAAYESTVQPAREAAGRLQALEQAQGSVKVAQAAVDAAKAALSRIVPVPGPADGEIEQLRAQVGDSQRLARARAAAAALAKLPAVDIEWEGDLQSLHEACTKLGDEHTKLRDAVTALERSIYQDQHAKITETACGLCGKDLSNVPEVVQKNAQLDARIAANQQALQQVQAKLAEVFEDWKAHDYQMKFVHMNSQTIYQQAADFIKLDTNYVPARWTWTGPDLSRPVTDPSDKLSQALAAQQAYQRDLGRKQEATAQVQAAEQQLARAQAAEQSARAALDASPAQPILEDSAAKLETANEAETLFNEWKAYHQERKVLYESELRVVNERRQQRERVQQQLAADQAELAEIADNNALISRLREVRPEIATDLWNSVSGSVSQHFSDIRGTPSVFTREDSGFRINGQAVAGLSGSTLDALGLAIRMSLTQTFLPNSRWMILDEPAAAADMDRETAMLAVVAASQFEQAIVVTHSDLIDSFANQVVRL